MATVVARINAGVNFFADILGYTIRINYFLGEALFTLFSWAFGHVSTGTRALLALIKVALFDFGQFVEDLGGVLSSLIVCLEIVTNLFGQFVFNIFYAFLSALAAFVSVVIGVFTSVYVTISSVLAAAKHLLQVAGKSLVLLLQTLPLGIAQAVKYAAKTVLNGYLAMRDAIVDGCKQTYEGVINQYQNARSVFRGLPGEAYLGFILLILILMLCRFALIMIYTKRRVIVRRAYELALKVLSVVRQGGALFSWNTQQEVALEHDDSPSSSFDSTPPYNLRQRKPGQRSLRSSRIEAIRLQLQQEKESRLCVICADRTRCVVLLPCRHFSFCNPCISQAIKYQQYCPVCRQEIDEVVPVYQ